MPKRKSNRKRIAWNKGKGHLLTKYGYKRITVPDGRRMQEHRYIMEQYIRRKLKTTEIVHHKNHIKIDNRISNLKLLRNQKVHCLQHPSIKCTRRWDIIKIPKEIYNRWHKNPIKNCIVPRCKRKRKTKHLCHPCYISYWKWKNGLIRNHFSKNAVS